MKKIMLFAFILLSLSTVVQAKDNDKEDRKEDRKEKREDDKRENSFDNRGKFQIGAKLGGSFGGVYAIKGENFDANNKFGFTGGIFGAIPFNHYIGLQPEVLITQKGFKQGNGYLLETPYNFRRTTTYVEVPLFFAFTPSEFVTLLVGPQYSYLLRQKDVFINTSTSFSQEDVVKQDIVRKNMFGMVAGFDVNLKHIVIGGRIGIDFLNNRFNNTTNTPQYKNVNTQITIGYKFYHTKKR